MRRLVKRHVAMNWTLSVPLVVAVVVALIIPGGTAGATTPAADSLDSPSGVAQAYIDAFQQKEWRRCADLMHPDALQSLKDVLVEAVASDSLSGLPGALYGTGAPRETIQFAPPEELYARMLEGRLPACARGERRAGRLLGADPGRSAGNRPSRACGGANERPRRLGGDAGGSVHRPEIPKYLSEHSERVSMGGRSRSSG